MRDALSATVMALSVAMLQGHGVVNILPSCRLTKTSHIFMLSMACPVVVDHFLSFAFRTGHSSNFRNLRTEDRDTIRR